MSRPLPRARQAGGTVARLAVCFDRFPAQPLSFDPPIIFFSPLMNRADWVQRQFNGPGTYTYHCDIHEGMRCIITVRAPESP